MHSNRENFWAGFEKKATSFSKLASSSKLDQVKDVAKKTKLFGKGALTGAGGMMLLSMLPGAAHDSSAYTPTR